MAETNYTRFYLREEFLALVGNIPIELLAESIAVLALTVPPIDVRLTPQQHAVIVEWNAFPSAQDIIDLDAEVAAFVGGVTTSSPFSVLSAGVTTAATSALVDKIDFTSPPLDPGTYSITFTGQHRLQTAVAGDSAGVRLTITFSGFPAFFQETEWPFVLDHAYNYAVTGQVTAGQTIRVQAQVYKLGAGAAVAEASKARFTIDKI